MDAELKLDPPLELALAYAPASVRDPWRGLLMLDRRLERVALGAREPLLAQIKLAWWRDRMATVAEQWPAGEPLLALLKPWDGERLALTRLIDAWEGMIGGSDGAALSRLVEARGGAFAGLARLLGCGEQAVTARELGRVWAAGDLAARLGLSNVGAVAAGSTPRRERLPAPLRPLTVMAELARPGQKGLGMLARIVRVALIGR